MYIYDIYYKHFKNENGLYLKDYKPAFVYGTKPTIQIQLQDHAEAMSITGISAWECAIAQDHKASTTPMARTDSGITVTTDTAGPILSIPLDMLTAQAKAVLDGVASRECFFGISGLDGNGVLVAYIEFNILMQYGVDPEGTGTVEPVSVTYLTQAQVTAIATAAGQTAGASAAQPYATQAAASATAAASSATSAATSATTATTAATTATTAKNDAVTAKNDAVTAKNAAVSAKNDAVTAKDAAVTAKTAAETAQEAAEEAAETAETVIAQSKQVCIDKAAEAAASATAAAGSATSASASATAAAGSATNATTKATEATTAATTATTAKDTAVIAAEGTDEQAATIDLLHSCKGWHDVIQSTYRHIVLGACTSLGAVFSVGGDSCQVVWTDPDDVVLNGSTLAYWKKTELWGIQGSEWPAYPGAPGAFLIAKTESGTSVPKNAYSTTAYNITGLTAGQTYAFALFSTTSDGAVNSLDANKYPLGNVWNVGLLSQFSKAGTLSNFVSVGQEFSFNHATYGAIVFRLMGFDCVFPTDSSTHPHVTVFESVDCIRSSQFDAPELAYALTEDTVAISGRIYYTKSGTTYTALVEGTDWNPGDTVPADTWYQKNPNTSNGYGRNQYSLSDVGQWLNSEANPLGFTKKNLWESYNNYSSNAGFIFGLDADLKSAIVPVNRTLAIANVYGAGQETFSRKVWLPSRYEITGSLNNNVQEGRMRFPWYTNNPSTSSRIKKLNGTAVNWWCASPNVGNAYIVYTYQTSGSEYNNFAFYTFGIPVCFAL